MNSKVDELLVDWEMARQEGRNITPEDLCRSCPELLSDLKIQIEQLEKTSWLFDDESQPDTTFRQGKFDSTEAVVHAIKSHNLLDPQQLEKLESILDAGNDDVETFVQCLFENNLLTPYQGKILRNVDDGPLSLDRYVILDRLGSGGMGQVYAARHISMDRQVAIKTLPFHGANTPDRKQRFIREIKAVSQLKHPNIVMAYDAHEINGTCFLVMEMIQGDDLDEVLGSSGVLNPTDACSIINQVADATGYAHRKGIIHRDIKPSNILLSTEGVAKLLDLGLARFRQEAMNLTDVSSITQENIPMGTIAYMAPEQARDARSANAQSDIYSLGCTFVFLLTGQPPFANPNPVESIIAHRESPIDVELETMGIANELQPIIGRMLAKNPEDRFSSMEEVQAAIVQFCEPETILTLSNPKTPALTKKRSSKMNSRLAAIIIVASILGLGGWGLASLNWFDSAPVATSKVSQTDLAKWVLNEGGVVTARTKFGVQLFTDVAALPTNDELEITEIVIAGVTDEGSLASLQQLRELSSFTIQNVVLDRKDIDDISKLENLRDLAVHDCDIDPGFWPTLQKLTNLRTLEVSGVEVNDDDIKHLDKLAWLSSLTLRDVNVDDVMLGMIKNLNSLQALNLADSNVESAALELALRQKMLSNLQLDSTEIQDAAFDSIEPAKSIKLLSLDFCDVGDSALLYASRLPNLETIYLEKTNITDQGLNSLMKCPRLSFVDIANTKITHEGVKVLSQASGLTGLSLRGLSIGDDEIQLLTRLKNLEDLDLSLTNITDKGLLELSTMNLYSLQVAGCNFSNVAIEKFTSENPDCEFITQSNSEIE